MPLKDFDESRVGDKVYYGGTGGYVFMATHNNYGDNKISEETLVSARGGYGTRGGAGGSGGIIVIAGNETVPVENADASGGMSTII